MSATASTEIHQLVSDAHTAFERPDTVETRQNCTNFLHWISWKKLQGFHLAHLLMSTTCTLRSWGTPVNITSSTANKKGPSVRRFSWNSPILNSITCTLLAPNSSQPDSKCGQQPTISLTPSVMYKFREAHSCDLLYLLMYNCTEKCTEYKQCVRFGLK